VKLAPHGWKEKQKQENNQEVSLPEVRESSVDKRQERSTWARLIKKVYGIDPLVCPKCSSPMKIIAYTLFQNYNWKQRSCNNYGSRRNREDFAAFGEDWSLSTDV
jgi:hypothetical protein